MRTFYAFSINDNYYDMYYNNSYKLYKILESIYHVKDYDKIRSYQLYKQVTNNINKMIFNSYITKNYRLSYEYCCDNYVHYIRKKDEHTKMIISSINIKITSDRNYPIFFENISNYDDNIFICDFDNQDYFWLSKIKKYRQTIDSIVK